MARCAMARHGLRGGGGRRNRRAWLQRESDETCPAGGCCLRRPGCHEPRNPGDRRASRQLVSRTARGVRLRRDYSRAGRWPARWQVGRPSAGHRGSRFGSDAGCCGHFRGAGRPGRALRLAPAAARLGWLRPAHGDSGQLHQLARIALGDRGAGTGQPGLPGCARRPVGIRRAEVQPRGGGRRACRSRAGRGFGPGRSASNRLGGAAAALLSVGTMLADKVLAGVAAGSAGALAAGAALWSLATSRATIAELAVLAAVFFLAAMRAKHVFTAALSTAGVLAAATGVAWAVPLASGWHLRYAAFAALGVAIVAVAAATAMQRVRPVHSVVLDLGAGPVILLAAIFAAGQRDTFAMLAVAVAAVGSGTAWLRAGARRFTAVAAAASAAMATLAAEWRPIAHVLVAPGYVITHPWQGHHQSVVAAPAPGLSFAVVVLAICLAAVAATAGAWQRKGRASLDAVAVALPLVAAPAGVDGLAAGIGYWVVDAALLALALV